MARHLFLGSETVVRPPVSDDGPGTSRGGFGGISTTGILKYASPTGSFQARRQNFILTWDFGF